MTEQVTFEQLVGAMKTMLQASARMYMYVTETALEVLGRDGEMPIRYSIRNYGKWRGEEMQQAHHALGLPINMASIASCWDNASTFIVKDEMESDGTYAPYDARFPVSTCPAAEAWKEAGFHQWGHVYCDEFHQACASSYHPDGNVVIPINMMKGDDHCDFRWIMPAGAERLDLGEPTELGRRLARYYSGDTPEEGAYWALYRGARIVGGRYWTLARAMLDHVEQPTGEEVLRQALHRWAVDRGHRLRKVHEEKGLAANAENLMRNFDLPWQYVWELEEIEVTPSQYKATIVKSPMDEAWIDLDAADVAVIWYEETWQSLANAYCPGMRIRFPTLHHRGDRATQIHVTLGEST